MKKLTSRKFWLAVAAFLGSVAASAAGLATSNETVAGVGVACGVASCGIYAACEAYVDGQSAKSAQTVNTFAVTANTSDKATVNKLIAPAQEAE